MGRLMAGVVLLLVATLAVACGSSTPEASFTATPADGGAPLAVDFTDTSANDPTSWEWDFGDGGSSTRQSASHAYERAGTFEVMLVATNAAGSGTSAVSQSITVGPGALSTVTLSSTGVLIGPGETLALSATTFDAFGNTLADTTLTWTAASGGTIDDDGAFTAGTKAGAYDAAVVATATAG